MARTVQLLLLGDAPEGAEPLLAQAATDGRATLQSMRCDLEKMMEPIEPAPDLILCPPAPPEIPLPEVAQMLRMQYPELPIWHLAPATAGADRKALLKNGFSDVFLLPLDADVLRAALAAEITRLSAAGRALRPVKLIDIVPGTELPFDAWVYLPINDKHVVFNRAGEALSAERAEKLKSNRIHALHVDQAQMPRFYKYTAECLKDLRADTRLSATERQERMQGAIRDLMGGIFTGDATSTEAGRKVAEDCRSIVSSYVTGTVAGNWYAKILAISAEDTGSYSHAANVSTYAAMFSMALGIGKPEELALAGLLHDLGLARVSPGVLAKPEAEWKLEERDEYRRHPELSVQILKERKLILPDAIPKVILQHHERFNGSGYPHALVGSRILPEAQVLGLADVFDELTTVRPGHRRLTPLEALEQLRAQVAADPGQMHFDPQILRKLVAAFSAPTGAAPAGAAAA
jgi:HD-GYP domain-containing protein (c-di-GMP phosphodiesterase class II)